MEACTCGSCSDRRKKEYREEFLAGAEAMRERVIKKFEEQAVWKRPDALYSIINIPLEADKEKS